MYTVFMEIASGRAYADRICIAWALVGFAECKWQNENVDLDVLETLIDRSRLFPYTKAHYFLFSKTGFTKGCMEKAQEMGNVTLVSYDDIVNKRDIIL